MKPRRLVLMWLFFSQHLWSLCTKLINWYILVIQFFSGLARYSCKWCRLGLNGPHRFAMKDWLGMWGQYMEYRIKAEESNLMEKYSKDDLVIRDQVTYRETDWSLMDVYLKEQNVTLDLVRFRSTWKKCIRRPGNSWTS